MLRELYKLDRTNKTKANRIRQMQHRGKLSKPRNKYGMLCYDTQELKAYDTAQKQKKLKK